MQSYSAEMRRDVLDMDDAGASTHEIAIELNVSKSWVRRVKQEFRESGKTAPATTRSRSGFVVPACRLASRQSELSAGYLSSRDPGIGI